MRHNAKNVTLEVLVRGKPVREYKHTDGYTYIEGRKGTEFELRIHNKTFTKILAVPSVDGLSVMDGKPASSDSNGYIVNSYSRVTIPGWRLDDSEVAKFAFEDEKKSYAESTGEGGNQGVISVMVFEEKIKVSTNTVTIVNTHPWDYWHEWPGRYTWQIGGTKHSWDVGGPVYGSQTISSSEPQGHAGVTCGTSLGDSSNATMSHTGGETKSFKPRNRRLDRRINVNSVNLLAEAKEEEKLGVGFGDAEGHQINRVEFERGQNYGLISLYYDTRKGLEKRGIQVVNIPESSRPNPFPGNDEGCVPPANWNR